MRTVVLGPVALQGVAAAGVGSADCAAHRDGLSTLIGEDSRQVPAAGDRIQYASVIQIVPTSSHRQLPYQAGVEDVFRFKVSVSVLPAHVEAWHERRTVAERV